MNLLLLISIVWIGSEVMLVIFRRSGSKSGNRGPDSILWLNIIIYGSVSMAVTAGLTGIGFIRSAGTQMPVVGLILIASGLIIRWISILTLWKYFTVDVAIHPEQKIVQKGLYRFIRHPAYLGCMISFTGLGLALSNWFSIILLMIPISIAFISRIRIEEKVLIQAFGKEYEEYCKSTWKLLPGLY